MVRAGGIKCQNCNCSPGLLSRNNRRLVRFAKQIQLGRLGSQPGLPLRKGLCWLVNPLTFTQDNKEINTSLRLAALRKQMAEHGLAVYVVPLEDQHQLEYTAPGDKRRSFISGFSGLAGVAVVTRDISSLNDEPDGLAALLTDGRYFNQALNELDFNWRLIKQGQKGEPTWQEWAVEQAVQMAKDSGKDAHIGIDPRNITYAAYQLLAKLAEEKSPKDATVDVVPVLPNLIDEIWEEFEDLPVPITASISTWDIKYAGQLVAAKLEAVSKKVFSDSVTALAVTALDDIAWALNLRGLDIEFNPVFFSFLVITRDETILFVDEPRLSDDAKAQLKLNNVTLKPYALFYTHTHELSAKLKEKQQKFAVLTAANWELVRQLDCEFTQMPSPIEALKAVKNATEIAGARLAQVKDGRAIIKLFAWLENEVIKKEEMIDEVTADEKLTEFRKQEPGWVGQLFDTISATGANAAVIHYKPVKGACTTINPCKLYLCDTGSQFLEGTTDITRTIHFSEPLAEEVTNYTLVLKGMVALARLKFPEGVLGCQIDAMARQFLWQQGLDYGHGTGHGIGAYLNVHEGPVSIAARVPSKAVPLAPGNYLSNEPGFYKDGEYGIRIENDMFVVQSSETYNSKQFLKFDTVSLVPYCRKLIDVSLLSADEITWLNDYHQQCWEAYADSFSRDSLELKWLKRETAPFKK